MDTEKLYVTARQAEREIDDIHSDARLLGDAITLLVTVFCEKHDADLNHARGYISDLITDLVFDAAGPAERRKTHAESQIADAEYDDLRRNAPIRL